MRLDVYVEDDAGAVYDIEMQCSNGADGELAKRTRYYQAMIDMELLEKGKQYEELKTTYIIFICTFDPFSRDLPVYTFRNRCIEDDATELGDMSTKLFLNSKGRADTIDKDIACFLRYVDGKAAAGSFAAAIAQEVTRIKRHDEWRLEYMTLAMELERKYKEGREEGREEEKAANIQEMLKDGVSIDVIARYTRSSVEYVLTIGKKYQLL